MSLCTARRAVPCAELGPPERAFSILNDCIDDDQYNALADYKKAMVMAQYNSRGR